MQSKLSVPLLILATATGLASLPAYGLTALPKSTVSASVNASVANTANGSGPAPLGNHEVYGDDAHLAQSTSPGQAVATGANATAAGTNTAGDSSQATASVQGSATASFGVLHASASGSASVSTAATRATLAATASFGEFTRFAATQGSTVTVHFGIGLSGGAQATGPLNTDPTTLQVYPASRATIGASAEVFDATTGKTLWNSPRLALDSYDGGGTGTRFVDLVIPTGDIIKFSGGIYAQGSIGYGSQDTASLSFAADASHTAIFSIEVLTPGGSYETSSGTVYPTSPVPEPASWALVGCGAVLLGWRQVRRRPEL